MTTDYLAQDAEAIFRAAIDRVRPERLFAALDWQAHLQRPLAAYRRVLVLAAGKASAAMVEALCAQLGDRMTDGVAVVPDGYLAGNSHIGHLALIGGGHPVPHAGSMEAASRALDLAQQATAADLVLVLISGGGSALWTAPAGKLTLADLQRTNQALLHASVPIQAINRVRKQLSRIKGGRLAAAAAPADTLTLVLSDVIGDDLSTIASGPTVPDASTPEDALAILQALPNRTAVPASVWHHLREASPAPIMPRSNATTLLLGSNRMALAAAAQAAQALGYPTRVVTHTLEGEARDVGRHLAMALRTEADEGPLCLLWGGETTVQVSGTGRGGRNQEVALAAALELAGATRPVVLLSGGTDGIDGPTDAAGAIATPQTVEQARAKGLAPVSYLDNNDAYTFFEQVGGLLRTGPTHTNVMDIQVGLNGKP